MALARYPRIDISNAVDYDLVRGGAARAVRFPHHGLSAWFWIPLGQLQGRT